MNSISVSKRFATLHVCAEMCLYYYVLAVLSLSVKYHGSTETGVYGVVSNIVAPWSLRLSVLLGACFAIGFLIVRLDRAVPRFLLSLLPGLSFFISPLEPTVLLLAAAWVYYVIYMTVGSFEMYLDVYRRRARLLFVLALLMTCFLIIIRFSNEIWYSHNFFGGERFGLLFFLLTVFSLRGMRLSYGVPVKMQIIDAIHVVTLPLLLLAVFFLLRGAVPVFTWFLAQLTRILAWLFHLLFPEKEMPQVFVPEEDPLDAAVSDSIEFPAIQNQSPGIDPTSGWNVHIHFPHNTWLWIIVVILAATLFYITYITIRKIRGRRKGSKKSGVMHEWIEKVPRKKLSYHRSSEPLLSANVKKVRKVYRSYLDHIRCFNMKISHSDTSEDVLERTSVHLKMPENTALRELYIAARYGDPNAVTSEQAAEARRCLMVIQEKTSAEETCI